MDRREALKSAAALMGSALIGSQAFLGGCARQPDAVAGFNDDVLKLLDEVGETIIPATASSPGAKAAAIGNFMKVIVTDCYDEKERAIFCNGISAVRKAASEKYGNEFAELTHDDKRALLIAFDDEARQTTGDTPHFFTMLNQLTVWGYFSSEPGATKALRYVPVPGHYNGCTDYKAGEGAWVY